jgi:transcriptional regulator with XRE-family HTH domain
MTEQVTTVVPPEWDLADRMRKSLRHAGIGVQEMADYLEVGRSTISSWINGRITPNAQTLRLWALRTGVPYEWLRGTAGAAG